ncbi:MAG: hypothetical protein Q9208_007379 [Pyrenodesmia sp. 3 TL-2023]
MPRKKRNRPKIALTSGTEKWRTILQREETEPARRSDKTPKTLPESEIPGSAAWTEARIEANKDKLRARVEAQADMASASNTNFGARRERGTNVYQSYQGQQDALFTRRSMLEGDRVSGSSGEEDQEPGDDMGRFIAEIRSRSHWYQRERRREAIKRQASAATRSGISQDEQVIGGSNERGNLEGMYEERDMLLARHELAPQDSEDHGYLSQEPWQAKYARRLLDLLSRRESEVGDYKEISSLKGLLGFSENTAIDTNLQDRRRQQLRLAGHNYEEQEKDNVNTATRSLIHPATTNPFTYGNETQQGHPQNLGITSQYDVEPPRTIPQQELRPHKILQHPRQNESLYARSSQYRSAVRNEDEFSYEEPSEYGCAHRSDYLPPRHDGYYYPPNEPPRRQTYEETRVRQRRQEYEEPMHTLMGLEYYPGHRRDLKVSGRGKIQYATEMKEKDDTEEERINHRKPTATGTHGAKHHTHPLEDIMAWSNILEVFSYTTTTTKPALRSRQVMSRR